MDTAYTRATTDGEREALARTIARLRVEGVPWDGPRGIVAGMRLVSSATQGRALLRRFSLDADSGGPVEILPSYDRSEINRSTGLRKGYRKRHERGTARLSAPSAPAAPSDGARSAERPAVTQSSAAPDPRRAALLDPLVNLARRIGRETGRQVPIPNPDGPTTGALVLFVLRDPGATETSGANETGVLDPYLNTDPTSTRQQRALSRARIDPRVCVWWNASPYHLGYPGPIRDADCIRGARYLREFVGLCPRLRVVVAMGEGAHQVATRAWREADVRLPTLILAPHPMIYGRGGAERQDKLAAVLDRAARLIADPPRR